MLAWIPVDLYILGLEAPLTLHLSRLGVFIFMVCLAVIRPHSTSLHRGQASLVLLVVVMLSFFWITNLELQTINWTESNIFVKSSYAHIPILILMLLCLFPLTVVEFAALFLLIISSTIALASNIMMPANMLLEMGTLWIVISVGFIGLIVSASLLYYVRDLITKTRRDDMTGGFRRDYGEQILTALFEIYKRKQEPLSVLFIDLDKFKYVNDTFGHEAGDQVLIAAAQSLLDIIRTQDTFIRWGGEEFLLVCPGLNLYDIPALFDRLANHGIGYRPDGLKQTASCGAAELFEDRIESLSDIIALADERLYKAKSDGRNRVCLGDDQQYIFIRNSGNVGEQ